MRRSFLSIGFTTVLLLAPAVLAQEQQYSHGETEALGKVEFPTSCWEVVAEFTRAVALLHSFGYEEARAESKSKQRARRGFRAAEAKLLHSQSEISSRRGQR